MLNRALFRAMLWSISTIWNLGMTRNDQAKTLLKVPYISKSVSYLHRWWCPHSQS